MRVFRGAETEKQIQLKNKTGSKTSKGKDFKRRLTSQIHSRWGVKEATREKSMGSKKRRVEKMMN